MLLNHCNQVKKIRFLILPLLIGLVFTSCSNQQDIFTLKGQFKNLNEAELYFWTPQGGRGKIDTIYVHQGKFTYQSPQAQAGWYTMLFQNMSEQVIFAEPGQSVEISADATHLRNMKIKGGKANALMTEFRDQIGQETQESAITQQAQAFIQQHPESIVSVYLFQKYFVQRPDTPVETLSTLMALLAPHHTSDSQLQQFQAQLTATQQAGVGHKAPDFQVRDAQGRNLTLSSFQDSTLVLCFWANWMSDSKDDLRKLKEHAREFKSDVTVLTVSLDLQRFSWRAFLRIDTIPGKHVCDLQGYKSPIVSAYGVQDLPTYILIDKQQQITAREHTVEKLLDKIKR